MCSRRLFPWREKKKQQCLTFKSIFSFWLLCCGWSYSVSAADVPRCSRWLLSPASPGLFWPSPGCGSSPASGPAACSSPPWRSYGFHNKWAHCKSVSSLPAPRSTERETGLSQGRALHRLWSLSWLSVVEGSKHRFSWWSWHRAHLAVLLQRSVYFRVARTAKHWAAGPVKTQVIR